MFSLYKIIITIVGLRAKETLCKNFNFYNFSFLNSCLVWLFVYVLSVN